MLATNPIIDVHELKTNLLDGLDVQISMLNKALKTVLDAIEQFALAGISGEETAIVTDAPNIDNIVSVLVK
jgi:hypothetical protein